MDLRTRKLTIATGSNSIMRGNLPRPALLLKSRLEKALEDHQAGKSAVLTFQFDSPTFEEDFLANLRKAQAQTSNITLTQYFAVAAKHKVFSTQSELPLRDIRIAKFLGDYFLDEPGTLPHLCNVSPNDIARTSEANLQKIIHIKPPAPLKRKHRDPTPEAPTFSELLTADPLILGQDKNSPGEMWQSTPNSPFSPVYSPDYDLDKFRDYCRDL